MNSPNPPLAHAAIAPSLGQPLRTFRLRLSYLIGTVAVGVGFTVMGFLGLVRLIVSLIRDDERMLVVGVVTTVAFFLPGVITLAWVLRRYRRMVTLCEGGLFITDARGQGRSVAWPDINGVTHKILRVVQRRTFGDDEEVDVQDEYTLFLRNNEKIHVDYHFADVDALGQAILDHTTATLLPAMRHAFHSGQSLGFGPIAVDRYRVYANGAALGWEEVTSLAWKTGLLASERAYVHVNRANAWMAWAKVPVEEVVNYQVLMALAREIGKAE